MRRDIEDIYALSPMQQGMLFHSLYAPDSGVYCEQMTCVLKGVLDTHAFEQAWQQVADRHSILRTSFVWEGLDEPLQVVAQHVDMPIAWHDWRGLPSTVQALQTAALLKDEQRHGFNLSAAPLMGLTMARCAEYEWQLIWSHHHLLLDGWSVPILLHEVMTLYEAIHLGSDITLLPARPYRDYIAWLQQQNLSEAETFWRTTLKGLTAPTRLAIDSLAGHTPGQAPAYAELET